MTFTLSAPPRQLDQATVPTNTRRSPGWSVLSMPDVRWAALATALFLVGRLQ